MKNIKESSLLTVIYAVLTALLVVSASIAVPLLCRPFYYAHIGAYDLTRFGLDAAGIRLAYDQMMDFCLGLRPDFSLGQLAFSQSGMEHFVDVKKLFLLDVWVLVVSAAALLLLFAWSRWKRVRPALLKDHGPGFWGAVGLTIGFLAIGGLAALDFNRAFVIFHALFFPGKTNWIFDWREDPIILLLPQEFFRNCAILILALILMWCAALILSDLWAGKRIRALEKRAGGSGPCQGCSGNCSGCDVK